VDRRPIAARAWSWPTRTALGLVRLGVTPNQVSASSMVFAALGALAFAMAPRMATPLFTGILWIAGAVLVQCRLIANLLDGLMAVEGGKKSPVGDLYNDVPDRVADSFFLVAAGYGGAAFAGAEALGWAAALSAALTAYVRFVGGTLLGTQDFAGPFAKQQRMFLLTVAALAAAGEAFAGQPPRVMSAALLVIAVGAAFTALRRLRGIARGLRERR
jgi:phosphatidylglycerophosphate synthase